MGGVTLTKAQKALLMDIAEFPGHWTACESSHDIRTARSLAKRGLVEILDELAPWFDCRTTAIGQETAAALTPTPGAPHDR